MHQRVEENDLYELAATLLSASLKLNKFLKSRRLDPVSFEKPAPSIALTPENAAFHDARGVVLEAAEQIIHLVRGPRDILLDLSFQVSFQHLWGSRIESRSYP